MSDNQNKTSAKGEIGDRELDGVVGGTGLASSLKNLPHLGMPHAEVDPTQAAQPLHDDSTKTDSHDPKAVVQDVIQAELAKLHAFENEKKDSQSTGSPVDKMHTVD